MFGKKHEEHVQNLQAQYRERKVRPWTIASASTEKFVGYAFSKDGISPDPTKVADVIHLKTPSTTRFISDYTPRQSPCASSPTETRTFKSTRQPSLYFGLVNIHLYFYGKAVTVYKDHKPLVFSYGNLCYKPPARFETWAIRLQPYQITVE